MARYSSNNFKINGPQHLKDNVTTVGLIKNPVKADNYAAHLAKVIASVAFVSGDAVIAMQGNGDLMLTLAAKSAVDPSGTALVSDDLSLVYYSGTEIILCMEITDKAVSNDAGDTVNLPATVHYERENSATV
jgi:hypothetical protein